MTDDQCKEMCLLHQGGVRRLSCMMSGCLFDVMTTVLTIRIFNGCEVLIENSVTRVTVRHHEACRVMRNSYPRDGIFNLHRRTIMDSFFCILLLRQLHLDLNMCCFYQFYAKITTFFDQEKFCTAPLLYVDVEMFGRNWRENDVKM